MESTLDNEKNKMCPSPSSSPSRPDLSSNNKNKVCVMMYLSGQPSVFLLDLDFKYDNVDANGFADMKPNFRVLDTNSSLYMCVVDATLYLVQMYADAHQLIYSIDLQQVAEMSDRRLYLNNKKFIKKRAKGLIPKRHPDLVAYRTNLILFSTLIPFGYDGLHQFSPNPADFELFDTKTGVVRELPPLIICRINQFYSCALYDSLKKQYYDRFDACETSDSIESEYFFKIISFVVDVDPLIVKTDLGRTFSLKLGDGRWRLCDEDYYLLEGGKTIMTGNGICFDDFGASDTRRWLQQSNRAIATKASLPRYVCFPSIEREILDKYGLQYKHINDLPSFDLRKDDQCMLLCTARQAFEDITCLSGTSNKLYVFLQSYKVNLDEFPIDYAEDTHKFLKRMTCFKFCVSHELISIGFTYLGGLHYF